MSPAARHVALAGTSKLLLQSLEGIYLFTLDSPRNPVQSSFTALAAEGVMAAEGDRAYIARPGSVVAMDISDLARPTLAATAMRPLAPMRIAAAAGKVVIADRYALRVYGPNTPPPPPPPPVRRRAVRR